ncbi:MAG TPA: PIG-L family deacetylase, partial [Thermoanaerobaculia bacterium]
PVSPANTSVTVCPPYNNPIVFFAAHPDDETLGMAGTIRAAKTAGRTVFVELMTRGEGSGGCSSFPIRTACGNARVNEFTESMIHFGVDGVVGGKDGRNNLGDKYLLYSNGAANPAQGGNQSRCSAANLSPNPGVTARVNFWLTRGGAGLSLRGTSGVDDYVCHPDHYAVSLALKNAGFADTKITRSIASAIRTGTTPPAPTGAARPSRWSGRTSTHTAALRGRLPVRTPRAVAAASERASPPTTSTVRAVASTLSAGTEHPRPVQRL